MALSLCARRWCRALGALLVAGAITLAIPGRTNAGDIIVVYHGPRVHKLVALTFDDGWSASQTAQILAILERKHVRATFFPYAQAVADHPGLWRRIALAGYPIGNHSTSHRELTPLSRSEIRHEICGARRMLHDLIREHLVHQFRPPYGSWDSRILDIAADCGYSKLVLWDVDPRDWSGVSASEIVRRASVGTRGSIILLHAGPPNTVEALPHIIHAYRERGYRFVGIPRLLRG